MYFIRFRGESFAIESIDGDCIRITYARFW